MVRKAAIAKIASPRLFSVIPRRRLFRLLDERLRHPVLWVEGPPGAGKTALVASYVESRRLRAVWYQIDPGDSDVSTFFYFLGLAAPKGKSPLPVFAPDYLTDPEGFARRFFRDFYARLGERGVLVLDNYQEIPAAAPIHRLIAAALAEIPEDTHVIAISRSPPPPEVCRLQAIEALCTIDWQELRLTLDEARAVAAARGMNEESTLKALYERSDGWMAGFVLMVERFRRGGMQPGDARFETQEAVFSYFAGQIFNTVPQSSQEILLQTAFLPWVTTELAERMTGDQEAWRVLDTLYRQHLFTDRRTQLRSFRGAAPTPPSAVGQETEHVFQFHALFRTFLLDTAATVYSAERYRSLVRRAGSLLDERGMSEEALYSYLDAQAWDEAVRLIEQDAARLLSQGRWQTLRNWIEALPVTSLQNSPWLFYWLGRALIPTSHTEARKNLEIAITLFHDRGDVIGELLSASAIVWSLFLEARATEQFKSWIPVLDGMLAQRPEFPSAAIEMTIVSASMLVTMWNQPDRPNLHGNMLRLLQLMDSDASANEKIAVAGFALQYCRNTANFDLGDQFVAKIDPLIGAPEVMPLERVIWLVVRGCHFYVTAQDERALQELRAARALAHQEGLALVEKHALEFLSYLCVFMGHRADAEKALAAQEQLLRPDKPVNLANYYLGRVFFAQLSGLSADALQFADRARDAASKTNAPFFMLAWDAALAGVYAETGQFDKAASLIARARQLSSGTCYACYESLILMDEAYLAHLQGDEVARNDFLTKALSCAKSQRTASYFRWMIVGMPILFAEALRLNIEPDYVKSLIRAWKVRSPSQHIRYWPWAVQIDALGGIQHSEGFCATQVWPEGTDTARRVTQADRGKGRPRSPQRLFDAGTMAAGGRGCGRGSVHQCVAPVAQAAGTRGCHRAKSGKGLDKRRDLPDRLMGLRIPMLRGAGHGGRTDHFARQHIRCHLRTA